MKRAHVARVQQPSMSQEDLCLFQSETGRCVVHVFISVNHCCNASFRTTVSPVSGKRAAFTWCPHFMLDFGPGSVLCQVVSERPHHPRTLQDCVVRLLITRQNNKHSSNLIAIPHVSAATASSVPEDVVSYNR